MDRPPFVIDCDPLTGSVQVVTDGFWTLDILDVFMADMDRAVASCRSNAGRVVLKVDSLTAKTQSAEVSARIADSWRSWTDRPGDRAAIITGTALTTLQVRRLFGNDRCRVFDNHRDADAWLAGP